VRQLKLRIGVVVAALILLAPSFLYAGIFALDEGERLSEQIANAAKQMRNTHANEMTIIYTPRKGVDQRYSVQLAKVEYQPHPPMKPPYAGLMVTGDKGTSGFCNRHVLFVGVPRSWNLMKRGAVIWDCAAQNRR
jgi:hypothetical protein